MINFPLSFDVYLSASWTAKATAVNIEQRSFSMPYEVCLKSIANFQFFCGVMLVLMFLIYADKYGHFECSVNFWQLFCLHEFWLVFDFCLFEKMDQRICIKFCVKNRIKCADAFRMLTVAYGEATLVQNVFRGPRRASRTPEQVNHGRKHRSSEENSIGQSSNRR